MSSSFKSRRSIESRRSCLGVYVRTYVSFGDANLAWNSQRSNLGGQLNSLSPHVLASQRASLGAQLSVVILERRQLGYSQQFGVLASLGIVISLIMVASHRGLSMVAGFQLSGSTFCDEFSATSGVYSLGIANGLARYAASHEIPHCAF